jgi:hypothetical protein
MVLVLATSDDGDDDRVFDFLRQLQRRPQRAARRDAGENALLARQPARGFLGVLLADVDHAVNAAGIADCRHVGFRPFADAGNLCALGGLHADNLDRGILFLQVA